MEEEKNGTDISITMHQNQTVTDLQIGQTHEVLPHTS